MNMCFISEYFTPFVVGGAELSAERLARELVKAGHQVTVITPNYGAARRETKEGINIIRVPFPQKLRAGEQVRSLWIHNIGIALWMGLYVWWIGRKKKWDIIHAQNAQAVIPGFVAARLLRCRYVVSARDFRLLKNGSTLWLSEGSAPQKISCPLCSYIGNAMRFHRFFEPDAGFWRTFKVMADIVYQWPLHILRRWCFRRADVVITVSKNVRDIYAECGYADIKDTMFPVYNIAPEVPAQPDEVALRKRLGIPLAAKIVLWAGRKTPAKGFDIFLQALSEINERAEDMCFVMAGRGEPVLSSRSTKKLLIKDLGVVPNDTVLEIMGIARVVVIPSQWHEPLSRSLIEAMAIGAPVVTTAMGGAKEVITDGVNGFLIPARDREALVDKVADLLNDKELCDNFAREAKESAKEFFSAEKIVGEILQVYKGTDKKMSLREGEAGVAI